MLVVWCVVLAQARCRRVVAGFWGAFVAQTKLSGFLEPPPSVLVSCGTQVALGVDGKACRHTHIQQPYPTGCLSNVGSTCNRRACHIAMGLCVPGAMDTSAAGTKRAVSAVQGV